MKTQAQILRDAAAHIRKVGKTSGEYFKDQYRDEDLATITERPCCTIGALGIAANPDAKGDLDEPPYVRVAEAGWEFAEHVGLHHILGARLLPKWSDSIPDTPEGAETVAKALEAAADKLEAS